MSEVEIRDELKDQGVITVGYLKVKVALFVPNPMRCFNCNTFGHTSQRCKVAELSLIHI